MPNSCRTIIKKCLYKGAITQKEYEKLMRKLDLIDIVNGLNPDRVDVIRCRDCKFADVLGTCDKVRFLQSAEDYCSKGERKDAETD